MAFLDRFFTLDLRERKIHELINICQGCMSVKEYNLKFTQLSKYTLTMLADSRAKINQFIMGISDIVFNECRSVMLIPIIDISRLMVNEKKIEDQIIKKVGKELKRTRAEEGNFYNS